MTLLEIQRKMAAALMTPLTPQGRLAHKSERGHYMKREVSSFIKPNDRLTSVERLEIYSRSYWFRLLDALRDDFPGLASILGTKGFERLARAYLSDCPSQSFTLRDLGSRLESWFTEHPEHAGHNPALALDMVRLEWAHIVAFDGLAEKLLEPEDLIELTPSLRVGVQPYISLLELQFPVDKLRIQVHAGDQGATLSSNFALRKKRGSLQLSRNIQPEPLFMAVHRFELSVYYRRLNGIEEFRLLTALRDGKPIHRAVHTAFKESRLPADQIPSSVATWFSTWAQLGWLTARRCLKRGH